MDPDVEVKGGDLIRFRIFTALGKEEHNRQQGQPKQRNQERAH